MNTPIIGAYKQTRNLQANDSPTEPWKDGELNQAPWQLESGALNSLITHPLLEPSETQQVRKADGLKCGVGREPLCLCQGPVWDTRPRLGHHKALISPSQSHVRSRSASSSESQGLETLRKCGTAQCPAWSHCSSPHVWAARCTHTGLLMCTHRGVAHGHTHAHMCSHMLTLTQTPLGGSSFPMAWEGKHSSGCLLGSQAPRSPGSQHCRPRSKCCCKSSWSHRAKVTRTERASGAGRHRNHPPTPSAVCTPLLQGCYSPTTAHPNLTHGSHFTVGKTSGQPSSFSEAYWTKGGRDPMAPT